MTDLLSTIQTTVAARGYAFVPAPDMQAMLTTAGLRDWEGFSRSWDDLGLDTYMADGGRYRRRRHAAFELAKGGIVRKPHQPHYQSRDYNALNGGIERWFEPVTDAVARHPAFEAVLKTCLALFDRMTPENIRPSAWHTEVHQFRVEAKPGEPGSPTPEGMHRDGVDWVLVMLIARRNVLSGTTTIRELAGAQESFTLASPMDAAFVDDARVTHGVTSIAPADAGLPAYRDVLVVTLRRP